MWDQDERGGASFRVSGWRLHVTCQTTGIRLAMAQDTSHESTGLISLVGGDLPPVTDAFVRGDELHLALPQDDAGNAGLELVLLVVQANRDFLVVESTLAIQTLRLDAHPMVELALPGEDPISRHSQDSAWVFSRQNKPSDLRLDGPTVKILVDERDQPSTNESGTAAGTIRFFGEFMEKGVIRKVQPWWVWSSAGSDAMRMRGLAAELTKRPLPLAN
jgi:hypothetical protein